MKQQYVLVNLVLCQKTSNVVKTFAQVIRQDCFIPIGTIYLYTGDSLQMKTQLLIQGCTIHFHGLLGSLQKNKLIEKEDNNPLLWIFGFSPKEVADRKGREPSTVMDCWVLRERRS